MVNWCEDLTTLRWHSGLVSGTVLQQLNNFIGNIKECLVIAKQEVKNTCPVFFSMKARSTSGISINYLRSRVLPISSGFFP